MASDASFVDYVCEQTGGAVSFKKMFGEYALYAEGKVVVIDLYSLLYSPRCGADWRPPCPW